MNWRGLGAPPQRFWFHEIKCVCGGLRLALLSLPGWLGGLWAGLPANGSAQEKPAARERAKERARRNEREWSLLSSPWAALSLISWIEWSERNESKQRAKRRRANERSPKRSAVREQTTQQPLIAAGRGKPAINWWLVCFSSWIFQLWAEQPPNRNRSIHKFINSFVHSARSIAAGALCWLLLFFSLSWRSSSFISLIINEKKERASWEKRKRAAQPHTLFSFLYCDAGPNPQPIKREES